MPASLVPLFEQEHGTIHLEDGSPAARATARVLTRRKGDLVEAPVYADPEKQRRLSQPLTADRQGRLPGLIYKRPLEIEASWRGRTITTRDAVEAAERPQAPLGTGLLASPTIPRGEPLTLVIHDIDGSDLAEITARDYQPGYDSNFSMDPLWVAPGFGIDAVTGGAYYDTDGVTEGEEAVIGVVPPFDLVLVSQ